MELFAVNRSVVCDGNGDQSLNKSFIAKRRKKNSHDIFFVNYVKYGYNYDVGVRS